MWNVNVLAVIVAALSSFLLGGLWYSSALFGTAWRHAAGDPPIEGHPAKVFGLSFLFALVAAFAYAMIIPPPSSVLVAGAQGLLVGAGLVAASFGINYQFANRPAIMWLIDGGYHSVQFGIYGLILGLWR
jgi:Protein of unknown function (DUF1761)